MCARLSFVVVCAHFTRAFLISSCAGLRRDAGRHGECALGLPCQAKALRPISSPLDPKETMKKVFGIEAKPFSIRSNDSFRRNKLNSAKRTRHFA